MSIDFEIFAPRDLKLSAPDVGPNGQVVIDGPYKLDDDDIALEYHAFVGKRRVFYNIHVEGALSDVDFGIVEAWFEIILSSSRAVLIDLQLDSFQTKTKSGGIERDGAKADVFGEIRFYFENGEAFYDSGFKALLNLIADMLPEALPRKFGHWEPLAGRIDGRDFTQAVEWFQKEGDLFMQAKTPFGLVGPRIHCKKQYEGYHPEHYQRAWFQLSHLGIELRPKLFTQPELFVRTLAFFERACLELDVVYAVLSQKENGGGRWAWTGLPHDKPHTLCVGEAYRAVWPELDGLGKLIGDHHQIITTDRFGNAPPSYPERLLRPKNQPDREVFPTAEVFPFDFEFAPDKLIW